MTRTTRAMLAAALAAGLSAPAAAQMGSMMRGDGPGWMYDENGYGLKHGEDSRGRMGRGWGGGHMMGMGGMMGDPGEHMDGRLAFIEAELGITEDQHDEWEAFASAVRDAAEGMRPMHEAMWSREERPALPERLDLMESMMQARLDAMKGVHGELSALYEALSPEQRERAERLMGMMM